MHSGLTQNQSSFATFRRSILFILTILILFIVVFSIWKSVVEYRLVVQAAEQKSRGYSRALKEHAERAFGEADNALRNAIDDVYLKGKIGNKSSDEIRAVLKRHSRGIPQIGAISLVDRDGQLFAHSLDHTIMTADVSDREYFIHHRNNPETDSPFLSKPFKSRLNNKWRITLSRSLRSPTGEFNGVALVAFEIDYFNSFYSSLDMGDKGRIVLVRSDGSVLLISPFREDALSIDFRKSHLFRKYLPLSKTGVFQIDKGKALLENQGRIIAYESLVGYPVIAMANMGLDEVTTGWRQGIAAQTVIVLVVCSALIFLVYALLRQYGFLEAAYDKLEKKQAELESAAGFWQSTFDAVGDAIWVMDINRQILRCNKATEAIFGKGLNQIIGSFCCDVTHGAVKPFPSCPFQQMMDTGRRASIQITIGERWYEVSVDPILSADGSITGAVHIVSDVTTIKQSEERYRMLVDNLPVVTWQSDSTGRTHFISSNVLEVYGYTPEEIYAAGDALWLQRIHDDDRDRVISSFNDLFAGKGIYEVEYRIQRKDSSWIWLHDFAYATMMTDDKNVAHGVFTDVTKRKSAELERDQLEIQLRQVQKMEAIGHLVGGIAHDFNNLLTPIMGYAEMIGSAIPADDPLVGKVNGIISASLKARDITQRLLSFGRVQAISLYPIDLNQVISSFYEIIRRTIRENIAIDLCLAPDVLCIQADKSQIEQIILNLTVNSQDAIYGNGLITIETCKVQMDGENARIHPGMIPGEYVMLSFSDSGSGMGPEVMSHIFEPFFTTKQTGHGTGLGLATVYGIVRQHKGYITVNSSADEGTTFLIYFPTCQAASLTVKPADSSRQDQQTRHASILVVEDNETVRDMTKDILVSSGYSVLTAAGHEEAVELVNAQGTAIDLLVSDVVMPGMSGPELFELLSGTNPELRVVFMSGYPANPSLRRGTLEDEVSYLQKPFTSLELLERIRQVL